MQTYVPASVPALTPYVSLNVNVWPLVPLWLAGVKFANTPAGQLTLCVTVTGRFWSELRMASETWPGVALGKKLPPVADVTAVACPVLSRPSENGEPVATLIAMTRMPLACRAAIAWASVWPPLGSWPEASPNQTMIREEPARQPVAFCAASNSALTCASGVSQPSPAAHWSMPA